MDFMVILLFMTAAAAGIEGHPFSPNVTQNATSPKDMYVVRATVYQVGILTRSMPNNTDLESGHQEAITFYRTNGSGIDMSAIAHPLQTNVTAENVVGVAPGNVSQHVLPWSSLKDFTSLPQGGAQAVELDKHKRDVGKETKKIDKGVALIPAEAAVQSIAIPPLLTLNNNMSKIPVPIPNVSVVSYAKVNTVAHTP